MILYKLFYLTCVFRLSFQRQYINWNKYQIWETSKVTNQRLVQVMIEYQQAGRLRSQEMNEMRFMYEHSPHYEQGYIMSEIVDRYRRMVSHVKRPMEHQSDNVFSTLRKTELIQKLYMEIYHLVHMMHEIPRKYTYMPEFLTLDKEIDVGEVQKELQDMKVREKEREREKKKRQKVLKKARQNSISHGTRYEPPKKSKNKWWPIDYGWEIDYYW